MTLFLISATAYLLGSIPFGIILARLFGGADVRQAGSGNIGATNVARVVGPLAGVLTLILDVAKGAGAVLLAERLSNRDITLMMIAAFAALVGHCFPLWLKFKGGKGVATAAGVFAVICPPAMVTALILFVLVVVFWRYVSLGSISAAAAMPLLTYFFWGPGHAPPSPVMIGSLAIALLVIYKHNGNLKRLIRGVEPKFSFRKQKDATG